MMINITRTIYIINEIDIELGVQDEKSSKPIYKN